MKLIKFANLIGLGLVLTIAAVGCRHNPQGMTGIPKGKDNLVGDMPPGGSINTNQVAGGPGIEPIASNPRNAHEGWGEDAAALAANTVHFDFDSSVVKSNEKGNVSAVADYLKANAAKAVKIEGHCDERGTEEYNRALGERRALALREELVTLGIDPTRIDTVTYGKDKPAVEGHDESAWKQNRRGVFVVLTPPAPK
ncbi:MAG TPA: OmpA family protein [Candidatus Binatia bacterium]|jgi:peptidoglycan-associated lipoprotein|nr:OmpA family protein [Candidatus Binatia bacterium]